MADKEYWVGSVGPLYYDDTDWKRRRRATRLIRYLGERMASPKFIKCPLPEREKHGDRMLLSYCKNKCSEREWCKAWREKQKRK